MTPYFGRLLYCEGCYEGDMLQEHHIVRKDTKMPYCWGVGGGQVSEDAILLGRGMKKPYFCRVALRGRYMLKGCCEDTIFVGNVCCDDVILMEGVVRTPYNLGKDIVKTHFVE